jgi:nitrite reductase/ring-hydroxylating ferredoxin subunit
MRWEQHRHAPAPGSLLCRIDAVPDGACKEVRYGRGESAFAVLLYRRGGQVRAYVNLCPHFNLPLNARDNEFLVHDDGLIMCAHHSAVFRLDDGQCVGGLPPSERLEIVPIQLIGDQIFVAGA